MWEHGQEINKVAMSFLRQTLGVHKKTTNIALMSETGKLPTILKVYNQIYKYWDRLKTIENELLKETLNVNTSNHLKGKNTWYKIVDYLLRITSIDPKNDNQKRPKDIFKKSMNILFQMWWTSETKKDRTKLDFYFSIKKNFGYEQ